MSPRLSLTVMASCLLAGAPSDAADRKGREPADRVAIPAGPARVGSDRGEEDERPPRTVKLAAFRLDRTEVTRGAYARCVRAGKCAAPSAWSTTALDSETERLPATDVSWAEAAAYCASVGGRLPTEAEWEKAARGGDGREYPWGQEPDCGRGNWGNFDGEGPCADLNPGRPVVVGSYPQGASPFGALDLGGNVWEWVADRYDLDPARRVVKGGSCCSYFVGPRAANRNAWDPAHRDGDLGFRCAYR